MDIRWKPLNRDSAREVRVILHPTASITDVRRGVDAGSNDSVDLSEFVTAASHSMSDANVTLSFNRELFGEAQPAPNQVLEIQLKQTGEWKPLWLGIVDTISQFTLQRGERSLQLIAKSRDSQDIWRKVKRITPLFPQLTDLTYIAQRVARSAGMVGDEIVLPPSAFTTAHSNTQLADMNAWDMIVQLFMPLGWTPFIDAIGRLRAADRGLQARHPDVTLTDDRLIKVGGQRQRTPVSRVRLAWLDPTLKRYQKQGQLLTSAPVAIPFWAPWWKHHVDFSTDKTLRAENTYMVPNPSVNSFKWSKFVHDEWIQQSQNGGTLYFVNYNFEAILGMFVLWEAVIATVPDQGTAGGVGVSHVVVEFPWGRQAEFTFQVAFLYLLMNMGGGVYEIWGTPYDYVHARNTSEAFDESVPEWVDNPEDIESDFVANEEHAKAMVVRELIYRARSVNKWSVTMVDDPRIEYGDILQFTDGSQLYVEDFNRRLDRGSEATLDVKGFLIPQPKLKPRVFSSPIEGGGGGAGFTTAYLTVTGGKQSGPYEVGSSVTIEADPPLLGYVFVGWTGFLVGTPSNPVTGLIMPSFDIEVVAVFGLSSP